MKRTLQKTVIFTGLLVPLQSVAVLSGPVLPVTEFDESMYYPDAEPFDIDDDMYWLAQGCGNDCPEPEYERERPDSALPAPSGVTLSNRVTKAIVRVIEGANRTCDDRIDPRYRIDCLRIYYGWVADDLPDTGEYLPIKEAMLRAEAKLDAIVRANLDESEPVIRPRSDLGSTREQLPAVRPIKRDKVEVAAAQAVAVIEETELIILRSGGDPARRTKHYTEVAAAVEENLIILRSA
jgi:hypothetical protein